MAQRRKAPRLTPEQQAQQAKVERMIDNTQRIMFIDSIVVNKKEFLQHYHLSAEAGQIANYQDFFKTQQQPNSFVYINELGNRLYLSLESADSTINLYSSELVGNSWSRPIALRGINEDKQFNEVNTPFMMGDGQTLYFAAKGGDGLGGYDIYVTRYDAEDNQFLRPANIGMPFNSEANDYMYVIDEYNKLGWFATDRNQPKDSVCIYIFEPSQTRQKYKAEGLSAAEIATYARIDRIADTWTDTNTLNAAIRRLQKVKQPKTNEQPTSEMHFVINDDIIYTHITDFKDPENHQRYEQLVKIQNRYNRLLTTLERARTYYSKASQDERTELGAEIIESELEQHKLYVEMHQIEKTIRNAENIYLTKHP